MVPDLPPDPSGKNDERASWADCALDEFCNFTKGGLDTKENCAESLTDLLCNLRHWADRKGVDWEACATTAMRHYSEETTPLDVNADAIDREENRDS